MEYPHLLHPKNRQKIVLFWPVKIHTACRAYMARYRNSKTVHTCLYMHRKHMQIRKAVPPCRFGYHFVPIDVKKVDFLPSTQCSHQILSWCDVIHIFGRVSLFLLTCAHLGVGYCSLSLGMLEECS